MCRITFLSILGAPGVVWIRIFKVMDLKINLWKKNKLIRIQNKIRKNALSKLMGMLNFLKKPVAAASMIIKMMSRHQEKVNVEMPRPAR
jgi:hypothetical protein